MRKQSKSAATTRSQMQDLEVMASRECGTMQGSAIWVDRMLSWQNLEQRGLIERDSKKHGYPVVVARITEAGRRFISQETPPHE